MTTISLFLYLAEVSSNLSVTLHFSAFILFFATTIMGIVNITYYSEYNRVNSIYKGIFTRLCWVLATVSLLSILTPTKDTLYLILGVETANYAIETESGQQMLNDIREIIQQKIEGIKTNG